MIPETGPAAPESAEVDRYEQDVQKEQISLFLRIAEALERLAP